jgi:hypothetical protein
MGTEVGSAVDGVVKGCPSFHIGHDRKQAIQQFRPVTTGA